MAQTFTQEDLIRFLYGETNPVESELIREAILRNMEVQNAYLELKSTKTELDKISFQPSQTSVDLILKHSQSMIHPA